MIQKPWHKQKCRRCGSPHTIYDKVMKGRVCLDCNLFVPNTYVRSFRRKRKSRKELADAVDKTIVKL